jgi:hypothetical protein
MSRPVFGGMSCADAGFVVKTKPDHDDQIEADRARSGLVTAPTLRRGRE